MERQSPQESEGPTDVRAVPGKPSEPVPTGPRLIAKFETLCVVIVHDNSGTHRRLAQLSNIQRKILKLLDLPDTALKTTAR